MAGTISIAYSSPLTGIGGKAPSLEALIEDLENRDLFEKGYGLYTLGAFKNRKVPLPFLGRYQTRSGSRIYLSTWAYIIPKLLEKLKIVPSGRGYITNIIDRVFAQQIANDASSTVYLAAGLNRCARLCHKKGKKIFIEHAGMWQEKTKELIKEEYKQFLPEIQVHIRDNKVVNKRKPLFMESWNKLIVLSKSGKKSFTDCGIPEGKIIIVNGGLESDEVLFNRTYKQDQQMIFITTAYHDFRKGTHRLLRVWSNYSIKHKLLVIGNFKGLELPLFLKKENLDLSNVEFLGNKGKKELFEIYKKYNSIGILPTFADDYPRSVVEYLAMRMPVIVTPPGDCDMVKSNIHGIVLEDPRDEEGLYRAITKLSEPSFYKTCVDNVKTLKIRRVNEYSEELMNVLIEEEKRK